MHQEYNHTKTINCHHDHQPHTQYHHQHHYEDEQLTIRQATNNWISIGNSLQTTSLQALDGQQRDLCEDYQLQQRVEYNYNSVNCQLNHGDRIGSFNCAYNNIDRAESSDPGLSSMSAAITYNSSPNVDQSIGPNHNYSQDDASIRNGQQLYLCNQQTPPERIIQRVKANKKERRRTQSINQAFGELRRHIPDVPVDTKLSKIKTLRLAISYINHLTATLNMDNNQNQQHQNSLEAEQSTTTTVETKRTYQLLGATSEVKSPIMGQEIVDYLMSRQQSSDRQEFAITTTVSNVHQQPKPRDRKHRTGWPEIIWKTSSASLLPASSLSTARHDGTTIS